MFSMEEVLKWCMVLLNGSEFSEKFDALQIANKMEPQPGHWQRFNNLYDKGKMILLRLVATPFGECYMKQTWVGKRVEVGAVQVKFNGNGRQGLWQSLTPNEKQKKLIEQAYKLGELMGLAVWCQDEAGPYQTKPYPGIGWNSMEQPQRLPHEYFREGTAKVLTLLHPGSGQVKIKGVLRSNNETLHPWLKTELTCILQQNSHAQSKLSGEANLTSWQFWMEGLSVKLSLPDPLPPLRMLLVWDNLKGHRSTSIVTWLLTQGVMPLYTPLEYGRVISADSTTTSFRRSASPKFRTNYRVGGING
jgi:hypothetical protein